MVQSPSWEANWFAASQVIPRISRNPKFHYRTHKGPPPVSILGQPNPSHLLEIHPNTYIYIYKHKNEIKYRRIKPRLDTDINVHAAFTDSLNHFFFFQKMYASISFACTNRRSQ